MATGRQSWAGLPRRKSTQALVCLRPFLFGGSHRQEGGKLVRERRSHHRLRKNSPIPRQPRTSEEIERELSSFPHIPDETLPGTSKAAEISVLAPVDIPEGLRATRKEREALGRYVRWYQWRFEKGEFSALVEFAAFFPSLSRVSPWFRSSIADLVSVLVVHCTSKRLSPRNVSNFLNRMKVPPPRGKKWHHTSLKFYRRRRGHVMIRASQALRILRAIYNPPSRAFLPQPWRERLAVQSASAQARVRLVWGLHRLLKAFVGQFVQKIRRSFKQYERCTDVDRRLRVRERQTEFVRRNWGTRSLPFQTLRQALGPPRNEDSEQLEVLGIWDRPFSKNELMLLSRSKLHTALLKIGCEWARISTRNVYRYKPVQ